jgi:hypothetical protein
MLAATEQLLRQLEHPPEFFLEYRGVNNALMFWLVKVTEEHARKIEMHEGVKA